MPCNIPSFIFKALYSRNNSLHMVCLAYIVPKFVKLCAFAVC